MTKTATAVKAEQNGSPKPEPKTPMTVVKEQPTEEKPKEITLQDRILKVEKLMLIVEKREKLVQTRSELEKFQVASNDFNCQLRLNDSDGNTFTSSFTPGIKKVIEFLKGSFDSSIQDVEKQIQF